VLTIASLLAMGDTEGSNVCLFQVFSWLHEAQHENYQLNNARGKAVRAFPSFISLRRFFTLRPNLLGLFVGQKGERGPLGSRETVEKERNKAGWKSWNLTKAMTRCREYWFENVTLSYRSDHHASTGTTRRYNLRQRVGTRSKFSPSPSLNVDYQVIFALLVGKKRDIFQHRLEGKEDT